MRTYQFLLPLLLVSTSFAQQPKPAMEYASVLTGLRVRHTTGVIEFESPNHALASVFVPPSTPVTAVLTEKGSTSPLARQAFALSQPEGAFRRLSVGAGHIQYAAKPGDYVLSYYAGEQLMTTLEFTVEAESNGDEFQPKTHYYRRGPWDNWAYMYASLAESGNTRPEFRMWVHKRSFANPPKADEYDVRLILNGDVVGVASTGFNGAQEGQQLRFEWNHPQSKGGRAMKVSDLKGTNGTYYVVVRRNKVLYGVWPFEVKDGRPQLHPRQASSYSPRSGYIVPRVSGMADRSQGMVMFMERLSESEAQAALAGKANTTTAKIDKSKWYWIPKELDPQRPFQFHVTDIETRTDTGFAVGEDMVVFGTGFPTGVKYMLAGENAAREIPGGEAFSSKVFCVCGRKILLTKRNRVFVFDTKSENMHEIAQEDISLYNPSNLQLNSHGYLVATVNKALDVKDRTILKVLDLSGDVPAIIPIKNANYTDADVTSVGVDSKNGHVAMVSRSKKLVTAAKIAPLADQYLYDVSEYRGVSTLPVAIEGDDVTYVDEDWKVRRLELTSKVPKAVTQEPIARSGRGFWLRKGRLVLPTKTDKVGSRYPMMLTDSDEAPRSIQGTGTDIPGTSAKLGLAGSAAIAIDKTVFIAGTPGDSIGTGERLQILTDDGWQAINGEDGKPVWGSEVVTSMGFMALKVRNAAGKTVIGYATYGERISAPSKTPPSSTANRTPPKMTRPSGPIAPVPVDDDPVFNTRDEAAYAELKAYVEVNEEVRTALEQAFGKEGARKKMVEMAINAMRSSGKENLIDDYKRLSPLVPDSEKPKSNGDEEPAFKNINVDPNQVASMLNGDWKAMRFVAEGNDLPDSAVDTLQMAFRDGKYVMQMGPNLETGTYNFDATRYPFGLTIKISTGKNKGQIRRGAFKFLEGNRLMFVMGTNGKDEPTQFLSTKSNKCIMAVYSKQ